MRTNIVSSHDSHNSQTARHGTASEASRDSVRDRWEARRREYERLHVHVDGALLIAEFLTDFATVETAEHDERLSLRRAAELSGYSTEHIARLVREGAIKNYGRRGKPLVRRGDLPQKPKRALASDGASSYDAAADARSLMSRQGGRNDGASKP